MKAQPIAVDGMHKRRIAFAVRRGVDVPPQGSIARSGRLPEDVTAVLDDRVQRIGSIIRRSHNPNGIENLWFFEPSWMRYTLPEVPDDVIDSAYTAAALVGCLAGWSVIEAWFAGRR